MRTLRSWWRRELCLFGLVSGAGQSAIGNFILSLHVCSAALTPREIFQRPVSAFPHVLAQRSPSRIAAPQNRPWMRLCLGGRPSLSSSTLLSRDVHRVARPRLEISGTSAPPSNVPLCFHYPRAYLTTTARPHTAPLCCSRYQTLSTPPTHAFDI